MKKTMKTVFNRLLAKKPENYLYAEWDKSNFKIPDELKLSETSSLGDALYVFYEAGGYDFFGVVDADQYAPNWLDFVGNLYTSIEDGMYIKGNSHFHFPLSNEIRSKLILQGVPSIFVTDFRALAEMSIIGY